MNIIEETTEKYRYNGAVSMKALEDDIVTLENLIESNTLLVDEARLRGFVIKSLVTKINEDKEKLNLLKVIRNRETLKTKKDDGISGVLGASAKNANGTALPETAASKKQPLLQNFEKAEIEIVDEGEETDTVESETTVDKEIVVENVGPEEEMKDDVTIETDNQKTDYKAVEEVVKKENEHQAVSKEDDTMAEHNVVKPEISFDKESGIVTISKTPESHCEYFIPKNEKNKEEDKKPVEMEKFKVTDDVYDFTKASYEEFLEFCATLKSDDEIKVVSDSEVVGAENEVPTNDCPPPTIDDYMEPVEVPGTYEEGGKENEELTTYSQEDEKPETRNSVEYKLDINPETLSPQLEKENNQDELSIYYPFPEEDHDEETEFIVSVGLHNITNMVNTTYTTLYHDIQKRELTVRFFNVRDYEVFIALFKKMEKERRNPFTRLFKKQGSIFMNVTVKVGDNEQNYSYEFTNCKLKDIFDTEYVTNYIEHECSVKFKYKKLKIK